MNHLHATRESWHPQTHQEREFVMRELGEILASPHFCNSKRYPALLAYIVEHTLDGKSDKLKERVLGIDVFDRPPSYDTNTDTVVRYTAGEVRKRLSLYYSEQGKNAAVRISLPAGSYVPEFYLETGGPGDAHSEGEVSVDQQIEPDHFIPAHSSIHPAQGSESWNNEPRFYSLRVIVKTLAAVALLGAVFAAGTFWEARSRTPRTVVEEFWSPLLQDQHSILICTGSVVFQRNNYSGVHTASRDNDYPFISLQNGSAIARLSATIERGGAEMQLVPAASTPLTELRDHSVTLIGAFNNPWSLRLLNPLRFHFAPDTADYLIPETIPAIVDRQQPTARWQRNVSLPYSSADDYALVARFRNPSTDGWILAVAGLGRNGTEAAALFVTNPRYLGELKSRIGDGFESRNIEAVLKVSVVDGKTGAPSILAVYSW